MELVRNERANNVNAEWHARMDVEKKELAEGGGRKEEEKQEGVGDDDDEWLRSVDRQLMTRAAITCESLGCGIRNATAAATAVTPTTIDSFDRLAQLDSYLNDLATSHSDLVLAVTRMELAQGAIEQEGMTHHQAIAAANRAKKSGHGHGTLKRGAKEGDQVEVEPPEYLSSLPTIEGRLSKESGHNNYVKSLQLISIATRHRSRVQDRQHLFQEALQCLETASEEETQLLAVEEQQQEEDMATVGAAPLPPVFVSRSSTTITLKVPTFWTTPPDEEGGQLAGGRKKKKIPKVHHVCIFGKPKGAGTAVSLNNTEYGGLGDPILMTSLGLAGKTEAIPAWGYAVSAGSHATVTVTGLLPGEAYVFAIAVRNKDLKSQYIRPYWKTCTHYCTQD